MDQAVHQPVDNQYPRLQALPEQALPRPGTKLMIKTLNSMSYKSKRTTYLPNYL